MKQHARTTRLGFSLIELLVVISIISIVMAISFPMIGAMRRDTSFSAGVNTVTVAIPAARRYALDKKTFNIDLDPTTPTSVELALYSGAAAIFTPAGEVRIVRNVEGAISLDYPIGSTRFLERRGPNTFGTQASGLPKRELSGFEDIEIDYLILPSDTGVVGINRVSGLGDPGNPGVSSPADNPPWLLPPPFAVWYNQSGYLIATGWETAVSGTPASHNEYQYVYYDGNYDGDFSVAGDRAFRANVIGPYDPDTYNPNSYKFNDENWDEDAERYVLPFEALEAVIGVFVYSLEDFEVAVERDEVPSWTLMTTAANNDRWEWMRENGEMIIFSKQSGALMRNRDE